MHDKQELLSLAPRNPHLAEVLGRAPKEAEGDKDTGEEDSCPAFGYLRGIRDRALAVELRFRDGNCDWFPYSWLGPWRFNPSVGLLLKFTGDVVSLVLIRGSNLDVTVNESAVDLAHGLQRHRILWVREMDADEARKLGQTGPTIDQILVAECASDDEVQAWLKQAAPVFVRAQR